MDREYLLGVILDAVNKVKKTNFQLADIGEDTFIGGDLGISSVEMLEVIFDIRRALKIESDQEEVDEIYTMKDVMDYLLKLMGDKG